jgi:lipopolysaccharide biosynthesis glycosyltransferase
VRDFLIKEKITNENKNLPENLANFLYTSITANDYQVNFIDIINAPVSDHISIAAYSRLFLSSIIPCNITKIIYLDCDLIVLKEINELFLLEINENYVGAIREIVSEEALERLEITNLNYFNSGVLIVNLEQWRKDKIEEELIEFVNKYPEKIKFWDQDVLNFCFSNRWFLLDFKFNATHFFYSNLFNASYFGLNETEYNEVANNPSIIHFTSHDKPWMPRCYHPKKELYFKYELTFSKLLFGRI